MNAVATLLYNLDYLPGALVLGYTLRKIVDRNTKLVLLIDKSAFCPLHLQLLRELWDDIRDTKVHSSQLRQKLVEDLQRPELAATFTKIQLWNLPYKKVLYLDADTLPLVGPNNVTDLLKLDYPVGKILAAPDLGFPDIFNSGVFALRPSQYDYSNLLSLVLANTSNISFDGADQGLLNQYFNSNPDWVSQALNSGVTDIFVGQNSQSSNWIKIPFFYNTSPNTQYQYAPAFNHFAPPNFQVQFQGPEEPFPSQIQDSTANFAESSPLSALAAYNATAYNFNVSQPTNHVKLIHFIGPVKPWNGDKSGFFAKWWKAWFEYSHGKSLHETLYRKDFSISMEALEILGQTREDFSTVNVETTFHKSNTASFAEKKFSSADLCDPRNYQRFSVEPVSAYTACDATREQPPQVRPKNTNFDAEIRAFDSSWGHNKSKEQTPPDSHEAYTDSVNAPEQIHTQANNLVEIEESVEFDEGYGYHRGYKAERFFDDANDYTPKHYLFEK